MSVLLANFFFPIHIVKSYSISKMYIRTDFAWYILGSPSRQYNHLFRPFWLRHRILHLLVTASTEQTRLTYEAFKDKIQQFDEAEDSITTSLSILGRKLRKQDAESSEVVTIPSVA